MNPAPTEIYTLSLHDALPILGVIGAKPGNAPGNLGVATGSGGAARWLARDRKSTRLNSSHVKISYAVFCLKKKMKQKHPHNLLPRTPSPLPIRQYECIAACEF